MSRYPIKEHLSENTQKQLGKMEKNPAMGCSVLLGPQCSASSGHVPNSHLSQAAHSPASSAL